MKKFVYSFLFILIIFLAGVLPVTAAASGCPYPVDGQLAVGSRGTFFAVAPNHDLIGWGDNYDGILNATSETITALEYEQRTILMKNVSAVWSSNYTTIALDTSGTLYGWGGDVFHVLWNRPQGVTGRVKLMEDVVTASFNEFGCTVLKKDNSVWMWGDNSLGQLGLGCIDYEYHDPIQVMDQASSIHANGATTFIIRTDGTLFAWGDGMAKTPTYVTDNIASVEFMKGATSRIYQLLTQDGEILPYAVGSEGTSSGGRLLAPVASNIRAVVNGGFIKGDGSLWMWETNDETYTAQAFKLMDDVVSVGGRYRNEGCLMIIDGSNKLHMLHCGDEGITTEVHSMRTIVPLSTRQIVWFAVLAAAGAVAGGIIIVRLVKKRSRK